MVLGLILVELEFGSDGFWGEGKTGVPREKHLGPGNRTDIKLNPYISSTREFEPGPLLGAGECSHHCATLVLKKYTTKEAITLLVINNGLLGHSALVSGLELFAKQSFYLLSPNVRPTMMYNNYIYLMNDLLDTILSSFLWRVFIHTKSSLKKINSCCVFKRNLIS